MRAVVSGVVLPLLFLLSASNALRSQTIAAAERHVVSPDITILLDLSYSMRLPLSLNKDDIHGSTRLEEAKRLLRTLLDREGTAAAWSLLTFGGERVDHNEDSQVKVVQNFTEDTSSLKRKIDSASTWGLTPLGEALIFAERYAARRAPGARNTVLVVSDGIDTVPALYELPSANELRQFPAHLVFAGIDLKRAPDLAAGLGAWMKRAGGVYVDAADPAAVLSALRASERRSVAVRVATEPRRLASVVASTRAGTAPADPPPTSTQAVTAPADPPPTSTRAVTAPADPPPTSTQAVSAPADPPRAAQPRSRLISLPKWLPRSALAASLLLLFLIPLVLLFGRRLRWRRARKRARALRTRDVIARFQRESKGEIKQYETTRQRVSLVPPDWERPTSVLPIVEIRNGKAFLSSPGPVVVNGVGLRRKSLETGDHIHIPGYLWTFRGIEVRTSGPPDPPRPRSLPYLAASSILVVFFMALFGWYVLSSSPPVAATQVVAVPAAAPPAAASRTSVPPVAPPAAAPRTGVRPAAARAAAPPTAVPTAAASPPAAPTAAPPTAASPAVRGAGASPAARTAAAPTAAASPAAAPTAASPATAPPAAVPASALPVPVVAKRIPEENISLAGDLAAVKPYLHTRMIPPGAKPDYFKADVMFIHAHPDDISINFGGLLAMEARAGKRVVSVVFTDGNAGLDQYPYRHVGGFYPAHSLSGNALAQVRAQEEESALSILGSQAYVRLGLPNNPYDSITEILPLRVILQRWGGERHVVGELVKLLEGYRPTIVVSPDKHHYGVFTHFEHEAVGYVTDAALSYLREHGQDFVRAHLIGVDPMLTGEYRHVFGIDVMKADPRSGLTYRAIQVAALEQHRSQRDASVIAVEVVPNFEDEYYVAESWNLPMPPTEYFSPPRSDAGVPGIRR